MENILDKNNSAHIRSYEGIKNIILGNRNNLKSFSNVPQKTDNSSDNQSRPSQQPKKGKTKFKDINTYQAKKKEKDG